MYPYPKVEQVGSKWYYWTSKWEPVKGPFDSERMAYDALTAELQSRHGW